ncbi:hypothetical protein CMI48_01885 [Candidatus Pacearchaeota archaeon]|nr:hypothetical protein [Candidatus Pacearchaeota archaeon]|tara:strand:+ start:13 stop:372 length:360 start_codon:yes stop_codon:yes gene_type:complete
MELVAFVGPDQESWGQITALMNRLPECEKVVLVVAKGVSGFPVDGKTNVVEVDASLPLVQLKEAMWSGLKKELDGAFEVAVTLASGTGKDHMALVGALLSVPVGIRIAVFTKEGVRFVT